MLTSFHRNTLNISVFSENHSGFLFVFFRKLCIIIHTSPLKTLGLLKRLSGNKATDRENES